MDPVIIPLLIGWGIFGTIVGVVASTMGRNPLQWIGLSLFLTPIGALFALFVIVGRKQPN